MDRWHSRPLTAQLSLGKVRWSTHECVSSLSLPHTGSVESSDSTVTVTHPGGQYCLRLFDHVRVRVGVEQSHAHSHSFSLHLLSCRAVAPPQGGGAGGGKREIVEVRPVPVRWEVLSG